MTDELTTIERSLWTNDPVVYEATLIPGALLVFGETGPITRDFAVHAIEREREAGHVWADVEFRDVQLTQISHGVVLLHYRATARREGETSTITVLASSLYVDRHGAWKLAFHQQTTAADERERRR